MDNNVIPVDDHQKKRREYARASRARNREKCKEYQRKYRESHQEERAARKKARREANLEAARRADREYARQRRRAILIGENAERYKEVWREQNRSWIKRNAERVRELKRLSNERLLLANPNHFKELQRQKYQRDPERYYAASRRWLEAHPELKRAYAATRRAREDGCTGRYTLEDVKRLHAQQKGKCIYCRNALGRNYEVDRIFPLAKGGSNSPKNIQLLCRPCNRRKHAKHPADFAREVGMLL